MNTTDDIQGQLLLLRAERDALALVNDQLRGLIREHLRHNQLHLQNLDQLRVALSELFQALRPVVREAGNPDTLRALDEFLKLRT